VQTGQEFRFIAPQNHGDGGDHGDHNNPYDADHHNPPPLPPPVAANAPMPQPAAPAAPAAPSHGDSAGHNDADEGSMGSSGANSSAYDRYISGLADISQLPFLMRYNAFADSHLDSLENPAYATQFHDAEARIFVMPSYSGTAGLSGRETPVTPGGAVPGDYSISPQFSMFSPIGGSHFFVGGSVSASLVGNSTASGATSLPYTATYSGPGGVYSAPGGVNGNLAGGGSTSDYYSGSLVLAARAGRSSFGAEFESLRGSGNAHSLTGGADADGAGPPGPAAPVPPAGSYAYSGSMESIQSTSTVSESRLTAGYSFDFSKTAKLGVFYRYAFIGGNEVGAGTYGGNVPALSDSTSTAGHSSEIGLRWRGQFSKRLSYGVTGGWLGLALTDGLVRADAVNSHQRDGAERASLGFGLGYQLTRRVVLVADLAGASTRSEATRFEDTSGATLQNGTADSRFISAHTALIVDLTRRLFVSASLMNVWHGSRWNVDLFPDQYGNRTLVEDSFFPLYSAVYPMAPRFSDFGAGWRFSRNFLVQYLFSTDYGFSGSSHTLMMRYTFGLKKE
jgi:hypothetical protein